MSSASDAAGPASGPARCTWVLARLQRAWRRRDRDDRGADIHSAIPQRAVALICWMFVLEFC